MHRLLRSRVTLSLHLDNTLKSFTISSNFSKIMSKSLSLMNLGRKNRWLIILQRGLSIREVCWDYTLSLFHPQKILISLLLKLRGLLPILWQRWLINWLNKSWKSWDNLSKLSSQFHITILSPYLNSSASKFLNQHSISLVKTSQNLKVTSTQSLWTISFKHGIKFQQNLFNFMFWPQTILRNGKAQQKHNNTMNSPK